MPGSTSHGGVVGDGFVGDGFVGVGFVGDGFVGVVPEPPAGTNPLTSTTTSVSASEKMQTLPPSPILANTAFGETSFAR